jgi:GGDEF domain-containing protein
VHIHLEEDNRSGAQPVLGLSIGVATAGLDDTLPAALLRADDAMYQDKRSKNLPK